MSDYASVITEPFWRSDMPEVHAYFVAQDDWTEITGDKQRLAFATVERDMSEEAIIDRLWCHLVEVAALLPAERDFRISVIFDGWRLETMNARVAAEEADAHSRARKQHLFTLKGDMP